MRQVRKNVVQSAATSVTCTPHIFYYQPLRYRSQTFRPMLWKAANAAAAGGTNGPDQKSTSHTVKCVRMHPYLHQCGRPRSCWFFPMAFVLMVHIFDVESLFTALYHTLEHCAKVQTPIEKRSRTALSGTARDVGTRHHGEQHARSDISRNRNPLLQGPDQSLACDVLDINMC